MLRPLTRHPALSVRRRAAFRSAGVPAGSFDLASLPARPLASALFAFVEAAFRRASCRCFLLRWKIDCVEFSRSVRCAT